MKKYLIQFVLVLLTCVMATGCSDDTTDISSINKQTILVYMPWSGSQNDSGLLYYIKNNLDSIEKAIVDKGGLKESRVLVFLSTSATESELYEIVYDGASKSITHAPLNTYSGNGYNSAEGITSLLEEVQVRAEALNYAMIIGCHGCGWTYKSDWMNYPYKIKRRDNGNHTNEDTAWPFVPNGNIMQTRFFGSVTDMSYSTDIDVLAKGIEDSGIKMQYILFDDCYMANVETAYELRNATNFLIGSSSEVMVVGMPYKEMWASLNSATPNYAGAVSAFITFYSNYSMPCGNIAAIDCRKLESLAEVMKDINAQYATEDIETGDIQKLCGFEPAIFYDLGSYVEHLNVSNTLKNRFDSQLKAAVRASQSTEYIYSALYGKANKILVENYSGLSVSDPSNNPVVVRGREKTAWWKATH